MTLRTWEGTWGCVCMFEAAPSPGAPGGGRILLSIEKGMGRWGGEQRKTGRVLSAFGEGLGARAVLRLSSSLSCSRRVCELLLVLQFH